LLTIVLTTSPVFPLQRQQGKVPILMRADSYDGDERRTSTVKTSSHGISSICATVPTTPIAPLGGWSIVASAQAGNGITKAHC